MVFHSPATPLVRRDESIGPLDDGQALVEVLCCTLCGSDLHTQSGRRPAHGPTVLGHEIVGRVVESRARDIVAGERVTWSVCVSCGTCIPCRTGIPQKCRRLFKYGHQSIDEAPLAGGLATHCLLRKGSFAVGVPDGVPDAVASMANCAGATAAAALRRAGDLADRRVVVFGAGVLGLCAIAMAAATGATVIAVDTDPRRRALAVDFGAADATPPETIADHQSLAANDERPAGADVVLELSGARDAVLASIDIAACGAAVILVGAVSPIEPISFDPESVVRRLLRIEGVHNYAPGDLVAAVEFFASGDNGERFRSLVEKTFPLSQAQEAFDFAHRHRPLRVAVTMPS
jgi:putative phosphonate catabolism associated alcohol dehydrogenase